MPLRVSIRTNLHDVPVEIRAWQQFGVNVQIPTNRSDLRLSFVSARDENGQAYEQLGGNWDQWHFARSLNSRPQGNAVDFTFAIHRDYVFECLVQPKPRP